MTNYQKKGAAAIAKLLQQQGGKPISLHAASCVADAAAYEAGRKSDIFTSLHAYADLLPADWTTRWLQAGDSPTADSMLYCVPRNWQPGADQSDQLLLGSGTLQPAKNHID